MRKRAVSGASPVGSKRGCNTYCLGESSNAICKNPNYSLALEDALLDVPIEIHPDGSDDINSTFNNVALITPTEIVGAPVTCETFAHNSTATAWHRGYELIYCIFLCRLYIYC